MAARLFPCCCGQPRAALGRAAEIGSIEVGKRADLVLLKENPLASVAAYDSIEAIFLEGEPIPRERLRPRSKSALPGRGRTLDLLSRALPPRRLARVSTW
jgi:Amidohydrolase family